MKRKFSVWGAALLAVVILLHAGAARAEQAPQTGVTEGTLTAKGENWIAVRADGAQESTKLIPRWIGGLPRNGGGLDKRMLLLFRELVIGSRLKVAWLLDEHMRVVDIQVLQLPGQDDEEGTQNEETHDGENHNEATHNGGNHNATETAPAVKEGQFVGVVTGKGENWISIRPDGERESKKFVPRWIGGAPAQGGGLDKDALSAIREVSVGAHVQVNWIWNEHLRLTAMHPAQ